MDLLRDLSLAFLGLVLSFTGAILVRHYFPLLRGRQELELLRLLAQMAVAAAEQLGQNQELSGQEKKALAMAMVAAGLQRLGLSLSEEEVEAAVEAAVRLLEGS